MDYEDIAKQLAALPNTEETRRRALLLKEFLISEENAKTRIADIDNGIFRDTLSSDEAAMAERLFNNIKREFEINSQKDLMDLWLMVATFVKSKRFIRIKATDPDVANKISSITKKFLDIYSSLGRELGLSRQQRLVRRTVSVDDTGSITELFAGIEQVELDTPAKRSKKKKKYGISSSDEEEVEATSEESN